MSKNTDIELEIPKIVLKCKNLYDILFQNRGNDHLFYKNSERGHFMKCKEITFRAFYNNFSVIDLSDNFKEAVRDWPDSDKANCLLTYGYIDVEAGMTLEVIACGIKEGDSFRFSDPSENTRFFIRIGGAAECEAYFLDDPKGTLAKRYKDKLDILGDYKADEGKEKTRELAFLDSCRHEHYPDDIQVRLIREGFGVEICWARLFDICDNWLMATLLNEPNQPFGYHLGEKIAVFVHETEEKEIICYSDMNPSRKLTQKDLEGGELLKEAISIFNNERTEEHILDVMEFLRDSFVWIPCNAITSEEDQKKIEELANDPNAIGSNFSFSEDVRFVPDILQNGDNYFFPVFTSADEMGEYGNHFSKVEKHFLEALAMAANSEKEVVGIVINAFSEPFIVEKEIFDIIENMKSRIVD